MERETGATLLTTNGGLIISSRAPRAVTHVENFFDNTLAAAKKFAIDHEVLDAAEIRHRFPQFNVRDDEVGYFERDAGFLRPEECVRAQPVARPASRRRDPCRRDGSRIRRDAIGGRKLLPIALPTALAD